MNVSDAIRLKRAVLKFTDQPLPEEVTLAILNAGRMAQSSKNTQPWHFIAITDKPILQQLSQAANGLDTSPEQHWMLPSSFQSPGKNFRSCSMSVM
jgi:nitroreductase